MFFKPSSSSASRRHPGRLPGAGYPCWGGGIINEETLEIDRELHPDVSAWVSFPYEAEGSLDALGPDRYPKAGGPVTYLYRNPNHLRSLLFSFSLPILTR